MTTDVALPGKGTIDKLDLKRIPERMNVIINVREWARSVAYGTPYTEPSPDFISRMLALELITASSVEEAFRQQGVRGLQDMIANTPGAELGNIEITDIYVAESDFETGNPSYIVVSYLHLDDGVTGKFTTGATNIQATIIALLINGMWPIRTKVKRGSTKDKGGRYLLFMLPAD